MKINFNKILSVGLSVSLLFSSNIALIKAQAPTPPTAPSVPTAPSAPSQPSAPPQAPTYGSSNSNPTPTPTQQQNQEVTPTATPTQSSAVTTPITTAAPTAVAENTNTGAGSDNTVTNDNNNQTDVETNNNADIGNDIVIVGETGWNDNNKNTGDAEIVTGNSNVTGSVENLANQTTNSIATGCSSNCGSGNQNSSNSSTGADSSNLATNTTDNTIVVTNNNYANLDSDVIAVTDTGHNSANKNTGNAYIETGDANVGLTVVNVANTDISGIKTSEFDVFDDHRGDIVIDVATLQSQTANSEVSNSSTGTDSNNSATNNTNTSLTFINNNNATVASDLAIDAVTGKNEADKNTGNGEIVTGDANVMANVVNLVNAGITAGTEVLVATVNVFGDWVGNLIFTDSSDQCQTCGGGHYASNSTTGSDSQNIATSDSSTVVNKTMNNNAAIDNGIVVDANTGKNEADNNTGGSQTETGDVNVSASETTVANTNVDGGTWWLVVVNDAGRWLGQIIGADGNATGQTVDLGSSNENTGANSENVVGNNSNYEEKVVTNNNANINNNIVINADTGNNSAEKNTGSGSIKTGDVNVAANIVNFVNTNFNGGKVVVAFVNVFGSWVGNVITPGGQVNTGNENHNESTSDNSVIVDETYTPAIGGTVENNSQEEEINETHAVVDDDSNTDEDYIANYQPKKRVLGSKISSINQETAQRIANGTWIVEEDPTITVTPAPLMAGLGEEDGNGAWWWTIALWAGLSFGISVLNSVRQGVFALMHK